jgi:DNA-binding FrmR family transcriptional regulator
LDFPYIIRVSLGHTVPGLGLDTIPLLGSQGQMSHTSREKLDLVNRTKKVIGQLEAILRALNDDEQCADVLQRLAAARGSINSLMAELMEDHIRNHMPRNSKSSEEAANDLIGIVRTYLK